MKYLSMLFIILSLTSCKKEPLNTNPDNYLTTEQKEDFKYAVARYVNKLPKRATQVTKNDSIFDEEYRSMAQKNDLLYYYKDDKNSTVYFAITKIAPSLVLKKTATIGKLKFDESGIITEYEEAIRTWKMEDDELKQKTAILFEKYINNEDVSPYYTKNAKGEFYIEFPDDNTFYDKTERTWKTKDNSIDSASL